MAVTRTARGSNTSKTSGTTLSIATAASLNAGDLLVVYLAYDDVPMTSVFWGTQQMTLGESALGAGVRSRMAWCVADATASRTITATWDTALTAKAMVADSFRSSVTGAGNTWTPDANATNTGAGTAASTAATAPIKGGTESVRVGVVGTEGPSGDTAGTWVIPATAGQRVGTTGNPAASNVTVSSAFFIAPTAGSTDGLSKTGMTSRDWGAAIRSFWWGVPPQALNRTATDTTSVTDALAHTTPDPSVYAYDDFSRTIATGGGLGTAVSGGAWGGATAGVGVDGAAGYHTPASAGSATLNLVGPSVADCDVIARVKVDALPSGAASDFVGVVARWVGSSFYRAELQVTSSALNLRTLAGSTVLSTDSLGTPTANAYYWIRLQVEGSSPTTLRAKVWLDGSAQPSSWTRTLTNSATGIQGSGNVGIQSTAGAVPRTFTFDDFLARPIPAELARTATEVLRISDTFARTVAVSGWGNSDAGIPYHLTGEATHDLSVGSGVGTMVMKATSSSAAAAHYREQQTAGEPGAQYPGQASMGDVIGRARFRMPSLPAVDHPDIELLLRAVDTDTRVRVSAEMRVDLGVRIKVVQDLSSGDTVLQNSGLISGLTNEAGVWWWIEGIIVGSTVQGRIWKDGTARPDAANVTATLTDAAVQGLGGGGVRIQTASTQTMPFTVEWDDLLIEPYESLVHTHTPASGGGGDPLLRTTPEVQSTSGTTWTLAVPVGAQAGDRLVVVINCNAGFGIQNVATPPAGWTQIYDSDQNGSLQGNGWQEAWYIDLPSGFASAYDFVMSSSRAGALHVYAVQSGTFDSATVPTAQYVNETTSDMSWDIPSITVADKSLLIATAAGAGITGQTWAPDANYTEGTDSMAGGGTGSMGTGYRVVPSSGSYTAVWTSGTADNGTVAHIAIKGAAASGPANLTRTAGDAVTVSDSFLRRLDLRQAFTDTAPIGADVANRAIGLTRTAADTTAASDSIVRTVVVAPVAINRTATDTTTLTDQLVRALNAARGPPDTVTTTDSPARRIARTRTATDSQTTSDSLARLAARSRLLTDTLIASDSISRSGTRSRTATDTTAVTDSVARQGASFARTATDATAVTDALNQGQVRRAADSVTSTDGVARSGVFTRATVDSTSTSDGVGRPVSAVRSPADTTTVTESVARAGAALVRTATDATSATDVVSRTSSAFRTPADATTVTDAVARSGVFTRAATDSTTVTDSVAHDQTVAPVSHDRTVTDATTASDSASRTLEATRSAADAVATTDAIAGTSAQARAATDTTSVNDTIGASSYHSRTADDTTVTSEAVAASSAQLRDLSDETEVDDSVARSLAAYRSPADSQTTTDSAQHAAPKTRLATDVTATTDTVGRSGTFTRTADDFTEVSEDASTGAGAIRRTATDTVTSTDGVGSAFVGSRAAVDAVATTESISVAKALVRAPAEATTVTEAANVITGAQTSATDTTTVTDEAGRRLAASRRPSDIASVSDSVGRRIARFRTATDTRATTDSILSRSSEAAELVEPLTTADELDRRTALRRTLLENLSTSDQVVATGQIAVGITRTATDAVATTDAVDRHWIGSREVVDTVPVPVEGPTTDAERPGISVVITADVIGAELEADTIVAVLSADVIAAELELDDEPAAVFELEQISAEMEV